MSAGSKRRGFSVRVFLPDGDPDGIKVVEKSNWTGRGLVIPRPIFPEARSREELKSTGVYILVGPSESAALPKTYIGEGDPVLPRLDQHFKQKDFWTHAIAFTSKDANLNKAHVQRLEARLVELANRAKRCVLDNGNVPQPPSLSEADTADVECFLDDLLLCLPILGVGFFEAAPELEGKALRLTLKAKGIESHGYESPKGFVVQAGSKAVKDDKITASIHGYLKDLRSDLMKQEVLIDKGDWYELAQDYTFASPSTAAGVLLARNANGRIEWKAEDGRTLKEHQGE
jgi:hypothetical protein